MGVAGVSKQRFEKRSRAIQVALHWWTRITERGLATKRGLSGIMSECASGTRFRVWD